eukprot:TRINITY_DN63389_c0_g1_i1.p1 TRINITY_DN63389_c0_g1~~TRINITY_DN63389_c0_g1_i1.p1  ORF type:complete len:171 (+),score=19.48 TRINITY_DN63389_c0_g1_i1:500-1012(+)
MQFRSLFHLIALALALRTTQASLFCTGFGGPRLVIINPPTLFDPLPFGFSQIIVDRKNAVAHIAGQTAINQTGSIVGETLPEQLLEVERNIMFALEAVEANITDITRVNSFIVDLDPSTSLPPFIETGIRLGNPVNTLVSTASLAIEGLLVEIQVDAAVSQSFVRRLACK